MTTTTEDVLGYAAAAKLLAQVHKSEPSAIRIMLHRRTWLASNSIPNREIEGPNGTRRFVFPRRPLINRIEELRRQQDDEGVEPGEPAPDIGRNFATQDVTQWRETVTQLLHEIRDSNQSTRDGIASALRLIADALEATESTPHE